ncbi:ras guanine nucleotide exchange factor domain-containing protein [Mycena rebaudengoi]|nr:ras guanine nucleotide exchange factor domain-containing protein [Mycena rebaudengoi]
MLQPTAAERERLRKIRKKIVGPALTIDTNFPESVHSDEPDAPTSPLLRATRRTGRLEVTFPSIFRPAKLLRQIKGAEHLPRMRSLAPVFSTCLATILKSIQDQVPEAEFDSTYQEMRCGVVYTGDMFMEHVKKASTQEPDLAYKDMQEALRFMHFTLQGLGMLLQTAESIRNDKKPLPPLPTDEPLSDLVVEILEEPISSSSSPTAEGGESSPASLASDATPDPSSDPILRPQTPPTLKGRKGRLIKRILMMASAPKAPPTLTVRNSADAPSFSSSTPTLLNSANDASSIAPDTGSTTAPEPDYVAEALAALEDFDMPLPAETLALHRDFETQELRAASLSALVTLLTSDRSAQEHDLQAIFFLTFRLFSDPMQLVAAIEARWDELPSCRLEFLWLAQRRQMLQKSLVMRTAVANLVQTWLDEYWRPEQDACALSPLRTFIHLRLAAGGVPAPIAAHVLAGLDRASQAKHGVRRRAWEERAPTERVAVPFDIVLREQDDYTMNLAVFETAPGRVRLAEQITARAAALYGDIDAEDAVRRWGADAQSAGAKPIFFALQVLEETMLFWVAQSVLELKKREERAAMIEFWLDMATTCVGLRNFSSASAIFGGLVYSPVERLSLTILEVAIPSKEQYRTLNALFGGNNNFAAYRRALAENDLPAIPLMTVLRKDVISANEISGPVALSDYPGAEKTLININAFRMLRKTIAAMEACLVPYNIARSSIIQEWIDTQLAVLPHAEHAVLGAQMDTLSRALEPRAPAPIQKGETWLQTLTGSVEDGTFTLHALLDSDLATLQPQPPVPAGPRLHKSRSIATLLSLRTPSVQAQ